MYKGHQNMPEEIQMKKIAKMLQIHRFPYYITLWHAFISPVPPEDPFNTRFPCRPHPHKGENP
jgi:hypothetical protein